MSPDHVHILASIPPSISISKAVQYIKGRSSRISCYRNLNYSVNAIGGQHLWARGYFVVTVGNVNSEEVQKYIEQQEEHHKKMILEYQNFSVYALNLLCKRYTNYPALAGSN